MGSSVSDLTIKEFFDEASSTWDDHESTPKEKIDALLSRLGIRKGDRVLDLACGTGVISKRLQALSSCPIVAIDLSEKMIEKAKAKYEGDESIRFEACDFLDFKETGFDWIVCYNAFPHFLDIPSFVKEANETLNEDGKLAILHSFGRRHLNEFHHDGEARRISRNLLSPEEEAKPFEGFFDMVDRQDDENAYLLVLRKRK